MPSGPSIIRGPLTPPPLQRTISDLFKERCTIQPHSLAIAAPQQNRQLLWSSLQDRVEALASGLASLGLSKGHRLGIFLAGAQLGAYVTLLNYGYTAPELVAALRVRQCSILITNLKTSGYNYQAALEGLKQEVPSLEHIVLLPDIGRQDVQLPPGNEFRSYEALLTGGSPGKLSARPAGSHEEILNLQFTSGSTGRPKAAALTQRGITNRLCVSIASGAAAILPSEYYDPAAALRAVELYRCTGIYGVPTMMLDMLSHPDLATTSRDSEIRSWVQQTLARYKAPAYIWWLGDVDRGVPDTWPTTANGKIRKEKFRGLGKGLRRTRARRSVL
ncbi:hypothetical protein BJY00DRAFT_314727 [Aspergillus carlsbadensis]|nr:hypothetical protein BJY00DRAFT_314727 [Aspergillus carlsbadensis]